MSTEAQKRASSNYSKRRDRITLQPTREKGIEIRAAASAAGKSMHSYILEAIQEKMERDAAAGLHPPEDTPK